jgi:hypothetical protein
MSYIVTLLEVQRAGVPISAADAVAVAQKLICEPAGAPPQPPFGPPSLENVCLGADGSVRCRAAAVTPAVPEIAALLQLLLPVRMRISGGLRYALARALHEIDAPPFDGIDEFSRALERFERGDRAALIRGLVMRTNTAVAAGGSTFTDGEPPLAHLTERLRMLPSPKALRCELRRADARLFEQEIAALRPMSADPRAAGPSLLNADQIGQHRAERGRATTDETMPIGLRRRARRRARDDVTEAPSLWASQSDSG